MVSQWRGRIRIIYKIRLCIIWITIIRCKQRTSCLSSLKGFFFGDIHIKGGMVFLWGKSKIQILQNKNNRILYMILILPRHCLIYMILILLRHYLIYDPESSPSLSYIWSWFFPVTVLYMILILPRHSCIWSCLFRPTRTLPIHIPPIFV
jgi:hypothetical protein